MCVPKNVNRKQLGELFRLDSWALADKLVKDSIEREDFWFKTSKQMIPNKMRQSGIATLNEINKKINNNYFNNAKQRGYKYEYKK